MTLYTLLSHNTLSFVISGIEPVKMVPAYCASKHGVVGFTRSLKDCSESDGVRINALCPGFVDTKTAMDWLDKQPDEIKALILSHKITYDINYCFSGLISP